MTETTLAEVTLTATVRQGTGKSVARSLRRAGIVPGIVYGVGDPVPIQFDRHEAEKLVHALHGSERLISLRIDPAGSGAADGKGGGARQVLLKDVQSTPVGRKLLHIDFHEVDVTKVVHVSVEVHAEGKAVGEKLGGILQQVTREVLIECLPTIIPEQLSLDVSALEIGDSLHVSDLQMPEGVVALTPMEETLFVVAAPRVEEEPVAVAPEALVEGALPEGEQPATATPAPDGAKDKDAD